MFSRIIALLLLLFLSPFLLVVAIVIFIEDGFPIFLIQRRAGINNEGFFIYKFRTMKKNTPSYASHEFTNASSYLLQCGTILRKLSIDEIPNLINIVRGEMAFIGPRPLIFEENHILEIRQKVGIDKLKPGLTGWAQINGRDAISLEEKIRLEKQYLDNRSFLFDCKILLLTITTVISRKGAK